MSNPSFVDFIFGTRDSGLTTQADPNPETQTPSPESRQSEAR